MKFWGNPSNRRRYFERFAEERGFDPLIAENWYSVHLGEIEAFEKVYFLLFPPSVSILFFNAVFEGWQDHSCSLQWKPE